MKRARLLAAGAILGGIIVGAAWPPPPLPRSNERADEWTPPAAGLERVPRDTIAQLAKLRWFGDQAASEGPGNLSWRLAGIVRTPQPMVLVMTEGKPRQNLRLAAGDALPDGSRLTGIEEDTILVENAGCQRTFQVHRRNPIRVSGECAEGRETEQRKSQ